MIEELRRLLRSNSKVIAKTQDKSIEERLSEEKITKKL
jgi:hypothetical protein